MGNEHQDSTAHGLCGAAADLVADGAQVRPDGGVVPDLEQVIRKVIAEELAVREKSITRETTLGSLEADSLEVASLLQALEDALGVDLDDRDFGRTTTVGQLVAYAEARA